MYYIACIVYTYVQQGVRYIMFSDYNNPYIDSEQYV